MSLKPLTVYNWKTGKRLAYLQNAYDITYTQQLNSVWTGSFKLPYSDAKNQYCAPFNLVEIWDLEEVSDPEAVLPDLIPAGPPAGYYTGLLGPITYTGSVLAPVGYFIPPQIEVSRYVGLFRIMPVDETIDEENVREVEYTLEHVLSTLLDSSIIGLLELGGVGAETTQEVLEEVLTYQNEEKWVLNECDYTDEFKYEFEDMNLLASLYYIGGPLSDDHYWSFNTKITPWELNLKQILSDPVADIRYKKNIFGIKKRTDPRSLCTRLYIYGNDGLSFSSINGGKAYVESEEGIEEYGIITSIMHDDRFETAQSLLDYANALIERLRKPFVTYEIDTKLIYAASKLKIGDIVRIVTEDGFDDNLVVQEFTKDDLTGEPNSGKIVIGQGTVDIGLIVKSFI
jgi:phage minor structural protein